MLGLLANINDNNTMSCAMAEREMLKVVGGDCNTAIGGYAFLENDTIKLRGQLFSDDGKKNFNFSASGNKNDCLKIGQRVGEKILEIAGDEFKQ